ncbi:MAG TPA: acyloxyacyl hydrolase [Gemmatimonadaceae bacterium]|nr:acyloxyacyl hydrolase [Gemmatimonadaceae bacterium]
MLRHHPDQRPQRRRVSAALCLGAVLAVLISFALAALPASASGQERSHVAATGDTLGVSAGTVPARRDSARASGAVPAPRRLLGAWVGAAFNSPAGKQLGMTPDRDFFLLGLRTTWSVGEHGRFGASWALELYPLAVVTNNPTRDRTQPGAGGSPTGSDDHAPVIGAGLAPLGLELYYALHPRVRMMVTSGAGVLVFEREVPIPEARRFNFTFDYGIGLQFERGERQSVVIGYRYHHLSNAKTAARNPGLDANLFYVGVAVRQ